MLQSASAEADKIKRIEDEMTALNQSLERHRQVAQGAHKYFLDVAKKCSTEWREIKQLEEKLPRTSEEDEKLAVMKHKFNVVLAADYQMSKLGPYWGLSPQPGSTYYLQKLSHDILGMVNHATDRSAVYLFDERSGPKNTDHTISYITHYLRSLPDWIRRIHIFLDNTCSTNKNSYMMGWACETVRQDRIDFIRISFMVAGHRKFSPDFLFSQVAKSYNKSDVFLTDELKEIIARYADVTVDDGSLVYDWRPVLSQKYSKFPGIRALHDFIFTKNSQTGQLVCKTRPECYTGAFSNGTIHVLPRKDVTQNAIPAEDQTYTNLNKTRNLSDTKMSHLKQMYRD